MIILVYGLSGSGKSTLSNQLSKILDLPILNGDNIRSEYNDWDFSVPGRLRQAHRIKSLASNHIVDIVCPLESMRIIINPDVKIYMNTISKCKYEDTNSMFHPGEADIMIRDFNYNVKDIIDGIQDVQHKGSGGR